jgi:hypothetical protein
VLKCPTSLSKNYLRASSLVHGLESMAGVLPWRKDLAGCRGRGHAGPERHQEPRKSLRSRSSVP